MDEKAEYLDVRSDSCYWAEAESYEDYLKGSDPKRAGRWESLYGAHWDAGDVQRALGLPHYQRAPPTTFHRRKEKPHGWLEAPDSR